MDRKKSTSVVSPVHDDGKLKQMIDVSLHVPIGKGEYGPAEDAHMVLDNLVSSYLMRLLRS